MKIKSVAFPWMGAMNGGIPLEDIKAITRHYLSNLPDIYVEVYDFDPNMSDPLFNKLKDIIDNIQNISIKELSNISGIQPRYIENMINVFEKENIISLPQFLGTGVIGKNNIEKLYAFLTDSKSYIKNYYEAPLFPQQQINISESYGHVRQRAS